MLTGYRPYRSLLAAVQHVDDHLEPIRRAESRDQYQAYWRASGGRTLERELEEGVRPAGRE